MIAADWLSGHFGTEWLFVFSHSLHNWPLKRRRGAIEPSYIAADTCAIARLENISTRGHSA